MLTIFNAPENITDSDKMFLNRQNIINVAISRARDALIVLMPDNKTEKIENLKIVKELESLIDNSKEFFKSWILNLLKDGCSEGKITLKKIHFPQVIRL